MISVVVPIYNSAKYLKDCIESVLKQTYQNFELLLLDDGSTDNSLSICRSYFDSRIRVVSLEHHGVSFTRNVGIDKSLGEYICFLDSDDVLDCSFLETMYELIKLENACYVECSYFMFEEKMKRVRKKHNYHIYGREEMFYRLYGHDSVRTCMIANKLFRKSLFSDLCFENIAHEDEFIIHKIINRSSKVVVLDDSLYYYRIHKGSRQRTLDENIFTLFDLYEERKMYFDDSYFLYLNYIALLDEIIYVYCVCFKYSLKANLFPLRSFFEKKYLKDFHFPLKRKVKYYFFRKCPNILVIFMLFRKRYRYV